MNITKHFESYRASLRSTALEGFIEYAKAVATADPQRFPKVYDYLMYAFSETNKAVTANDVSAYRSWVTHHQGALISLFERMVGDEMWEYSSTTAGDLLDLIKQRGWPRFKFSKVGIEMDLETDGQIMTMAWIPRYTPELSNIWTDPKKVCFDADELRWFQSAPSGSSLKHIAGEKMRNPGQKLIDIGGMYPYYRPVNKVNEPEKVIDWAAPLF